MTKFEDVKGFVYAVFFMIVDHADNSMGDFESRTLKVMDGINTIEILGLRNFDFYDNGVLPQFTIGF